jgi:2'-5' RNA ligase
MKKRLFFALQAAAPWPSELPVGKLLEEDQRHLTLAFLGETDFSQLEAALDSFPQPPFTVSFAGQFDRCLFLPPRHPRCVTWHVQWLEPVDKLIQFRRDLHAWLLAKGFPLKERLDLLPHVTLSRPPFKPADWSRSFRQLPVIFQDLHLYESLGNSKYQSIWHYPLYPPFQEIEHTADIAFQVHGENLSQLQTHALTALAFKCPELLRFVDKLEQPSDGDDLVIHLNQAVSAIDEEIGCSFKAVSFSGEVKQEKDKLTWEMIVDV